MEKYSGSPEEGSGRERGRSGSELARRLLVAGVGIPVGFAVVYLGGWVLGGVIALVAAVAAREFFGLASLGGARPLVWIGVPAAAALVLLAALLPDFRDFAPWALSLVVGLGFLVLAATVWLRWPGGRPLTSASSTLMGVLYAGGGLAFAPLLRGLPATRGAVDDSWAGALLLILPLTITWMGDSAAYFAGRTWGRRKLIPRVSPGKTVVGGIAGLAVSALVGALFAGLLLSDRAAFSLGFVGGGVLGLLVGATAQVGDLVESVLKREAGVKDAGRLLPGHGGALDRFDAVLLTLPLTYALLVAGEALFR